MEAGREIIRCGSKRTWRRPWTVDKVMHSLRDKKGRDNEEGGEMVTDGGAVTCRNPSSLPEPRGRREGVAPAALPLALRRPSAQQRAA